MQRAGLRVHAPIKVGDKFGKQEVIGPAAPREYADGGKKAFWTVRCACGYTRPVAASELAGGKSSACRKCQDRPGNQRPWTPEQRRAASSINKKHGLAGSPTYLSWRAMKSRCYRVTDVGYPDYGGRGITVCDRWLHGDGIKSGFECFVADMGLRPSPEHQNERIDNDGNYEPGNCRWATHTEQQRNRRCTAWIDTPEGRLSLAAACEQVGADLEAVRKRVVRGMPFEKAVSLAKARIRADAAMVETADGLRPLIEVGKAAVVPYQLFAYRVLRKGWPLDRALNTPAMRRGPLPRKRA